MGFFIESLALGSWFFTVLPHMLRKRPEICYVLEASSLTMRVARGCARLLKIKIERFKFRYTDIHDEQGVAVGRKIFHYDLAEVQSQILAKPAFHALEKADLLNGRLRTFLAKKIVGGSLHFDRESLVRALFLVQVLKWQLRRNRTINGETVLILEKRLWSQEIEQYAKSHGIRVMSILPNPSQKRLRQWLGRLPGMRGLIRLYFWYKQRRYYPSSSAKKGTSTPPINPQAQIKLAVEYYGQLNLNQPSCYSDLFFWQQSRFCSQNLLLTFNLAKDPLDQDKLVALQTHGISAVALSQGARGCAEAPLFLSTSRKGYYERSNSWFVSLSKNKETRWLTEQIYEYWNQQKYWEDLFASYNVRMYLTWFKHGAQHCSIAEVLKSLNGITAAYQRSYEEIPAVGLATAADIEFAFSPAHAEVERLSGSVIPYHVVVGYLGDHRLPLLKEKAAHLRKLLKECGAERIVAFCDENTLPDSRWHKGHEFTQRNYAFLLNKVLSEPWFGLVIKPKAPTTIRQRLGPVAEVMECAERTGRCYVYGEGAIHSIHPPALAALSADLTIHEHLYAATAGMESALAGVPTLLMDHDNWQFSSLYRLGLGRVIFTDWDSMWEACCEHWRTPRGIPGFGDWAPVLDELDPLRDGRAAERMGTYLQWLVEGLEEGLDRELVMARAAERYCECWGNDKVSSVNAG